MDLAVTDFVAELGGNSIRPPMDSSEAELSDPEAPQGFCKHNLPEIVHIRFILK